MPLSARIPQLAELEVLLAVARTGSLNAAARQAGITQQAASARIRSAEARAGVCLVSRTARGSTLTREGVVAAEWAARLLAVVGELDAGLAALRNDHHTRLRVSASLTIAEQLLPGWLVSLQAAGQHPRRAARPDRAHRREQRNRCPAGPPGQRGPGIRRGTRAPEGAAQPRHRARHPRRGRPPRPPVGAAPPAAEPRRAGRDRAGEPGGGIGNTRRAGRRAR